MLIKSGIIVAFFTMLSRVFGLAREFFIAALFGTSATADCVNVAFKFPNLFRRIFGEGALSAVFIPMYSEKLVDSEESAKQFGGKIFSLLIITLTAITLLLQFSMYYVMVIIAPGFYSDPEKFALAVELCQITTPYLIFISAVALFGGMLNSVKRFAAFAFVPIILNISIILFTLILKNKLTPEHGIAYSLIIGGILQIIFMVICLYKVKLNFPLTFKPKDKEVSKLLINMGPAAMSSSAQQLMLFVSQSIASFLPGAVSILAYAERLYQLPIALIGITFGTILLPELSKIYKQNNFKKANEIQNKAIKIAVTLSIPAMIGLMILSEPIMHLIYERGAFTREDTLASSKALAAFSIGLPAFVLSKIITPIFYANLDTKTPFKITICCLLIDTVLNLALIIPFGYVGIALATSFSSWINIYFLNKYAKQYGDFHITHSTKIFTIKALIASLIMGGFVFVSSIYGHEYFFHESNLIKIISLFGSITFAVTIFLIMIYLFDMHKEAFKKAEDN